VSERPTGAGTAPPRRRAFRRLRDLPIWSKLGVIMIIPTLATIVVGTNGLLGHLDTLGNANRARTLAQLSEGSGELVHHLQGERAAAVMLLGAAGEAELEERTARYVETQELVDDARNGYQDRRTSLTGLPPGFRSLLNDIGGRLSSLPQIRSRIAAGEFGLTDAAASYEELISGLLTIRESSAQLSGEIAMGDRMRAAAAISRSKEYLSRQRVVGHEVLIRGTYHPHLRAAFIGTQTGRAQAEEQFAAVATGAEQTMLEQTLDGPDVRQSTLYQDYLDSLEGEDLGDPPWDAASWDEVMSAHADLLREIEADLDSEVVDLATTMRNDVTTRVVLETAGLLVMLLLAIFLAWLVARSMARSLRELRQGALAVAQYGLPQAVARLRDPALSTQLSPAKLAEQIAAPLPLRGRDEFGQVTEAFNAVHLEAVRTAAEQASLRASVATMFVNLARRSQLLVDRLIGYLDRLERGEEDPDRLAELFQLDHLATRMRRNDENLLVLAGADSTRVQRRPAALLDVLRAAQSEVEHYTRIEFGVVDRDIEVAAHAVNDLVHLVAELFDNATAFSAPDSRVTVEARRVGDRAVLYIEDQGLGLSSDQLAEINQRLATPPPVDVGVSRMMGLVVVARLAARHGVRVELRRGVERGTVADVTLPAQVLVSHSLAKTLPLTEVVGRSPSGLATPRAPLALESGPALERIRPLPTSPAPSPPAERPMSAPPGTKLPAWSDLTGAGGPNGAEVDEPPTGGPLPRRRPGASRAFEPDLGGDVSMIPHQRPPDREPPGPDAPGESPGESAEAPRSEPSPQEADATAGAGQPPTWPPATPAATPPAAPTPAPPDAGPPAEADAAAAAGARAEGEHRAVPRPARERRDDETMELPIYRQVESAWFRTKPRPAPADAGAGTRQGGVGAYAAVGGTSTTTGDASMANAPGSTIPDRQAVRSGDQVGSEWRTAADDGWRAASSLAESRVEGTTQSGLPKRRPMAQLVPGGVDMAQGPPQQRSPEAVRGLLSAYHRGVQRGRMQGDEAPQSAQAGKEQGE
jgi:signal transduction histidine kinase